MQLHYKRSDNKLKFQLSIGHASNIRSISPPLWYLGQGSFRFAVEQAYQQCAVTKEHSIPALEAAHIKPYSLGGFHEVNNGLLLRADIHKLFDKGYVTITPDYYFKVSEHLKSEYHNGKIYYEMNARKIWLPENQLNKPCQENLEYYQNHIFLR